MGREQRVHPHWCKVKELVGRATIPVLKDCMDGTNKIEYILRDISKIAAVYNLSSFILRVFIFVFAPELLSFFGLKSVNSSLEIIRLILFLRCTF